MTSCRHRLAERVNRKDWSSIAHSRQVARDDVEDPHEGPIPGSRRSSSSPPALSSRGHALDEEEGEDSTASGCADGGGQRPMVPVAGGAQMMTVPRTASFSEGVWCGQIEPRLLPTDFALAAMPRRAVEHSCNQIQTHEFDVGRHCREFSILKRYRHTSVGTGAVYRSRRTATDRRAIQRAPLSSSATPHG